MDTGRMEGPRCEGVAPVSCSDSRITSGRLNCTWCGDVVSQVEFSGLRPHASEPENRSFK